MRVVVSTGGSACSQIAAATTPNANTGKRGNEGRSKGSDEKDEQSWRCAWFDLPGDPLLSSA